LFRENLGAGSTHRSTSGHGSTDAFLPYSRAWMVKLAKGSMYGRAIVAHCHISERLKPCVHNHHTHRPIYREDSRHLQRYIRFVTISAGLIPGVIFIRLYWQTDPNLKSFLLTLKICADSRNEEERPLLKVGVNFYGFARDRGSLVS
jgi:hypothetical protein